MFARGSPFRVMLALLSLVVMLALAHSPPIPQPTEGVSVAVVDVPSIAAQDLSIVSDLVAASVLVPPSERLVRSTAYSTNVTPNALLAMQSPAINTNAARPPDRQRM